MRTYGEFTWEQALLAAVVQKVAACHSNTDFGRTAIQKLLYFLRVLGVPMRYSFDIHHYGPYCAEIRNDIEWLQVEEAISDDASADARHSKYKPGSAIQAALSAHAERLAEFELPINNVVEVLGDMSPHNLELIATLDFSFRWVRATGGSGPWKDRTIAKFKSIKKEKFADSEIDQWYAALSDAKLIEP